MNKWEGAKSKVKYFNSKHKNQKLNKFFVATSALPEMLETIFSQGYRDDLSELLM